ncbi:putative transcription factor KAN2 [Senna tora]|uniref:Putative transcription factor KAN2 n=1 Tax=Senna tora TaxID=362788 RepID=A0A834X290_9FABA|nr:putative transcription factor KAN2 [Senna tora]
MSGSIEEVEEVKMDGRQRINALTSLGKRKAEVVRSFQEDGSIVAMAYNVVAIPVAVGVFFPSLGIKLPPWVAGACMALSSMYRMVKTIDRAAASSGQYDVQDNASSGDTSEDFMFDMNNSRNSDLSTKQEKPCAIQDKQHHGLWSNSSRSQHIPTNNVAD